MGTRIQIWSTAKTLATGAVIGLTISDRYLTIVTTKGDSMHPTLTAADSFFRGILQIQFLHKSNNKSMRVQIALLELYSAIGIQRFRADQVARTR
jgi:hypothetical protein